MPKITIAEQDLTGVSYTGDETVVYVPGLVSFVDGVGYDDNKCYLIKPSDNLSKVLSFTAEKDTSGTIEDSDKLRTVLYIENLLSKGLYVLYNYMEEVPGSTTDVSYLKDKNMYNVKYLTSGVTPTLSIQKTTNTSEDNKTTIGYAIDSGFSSQLELVAANRQDCVVLIDIREFQVDTEEKTPSLAEIKEAFDSSSSGIVSEGTYCACFYPNGNYVLTSSAYSDQGIIDFECEMPASFGYLLCAGDAIKANKRWDSVAGVTRGVLPSSFKNNTTTVSKYDLDHDVHDSEKGGVCFNGIVDIKPYGYTLWGDRTLRKNGSGVYGLKASSFLSTRLMLCDIKKRIYNAAIQNTYETNNDITWMNFKSQIASLLNQMSADGKLESYKIIKLPSDYMSQIKCKIRLVPNMPVEDFDVYITLENAAAEVTEG